MHYSCLKIHQKKMKHNEFFYFPVDELLSSIVNDNLLSDDINFKELICSRYLAVFELFEQEH